MDAVARPRLAVIGCGHLARTQVLPALRHLNWLPDVLVDPVSGHVQGAARGFHKQHSVVTAPDWSSVADRFDAAILVTPNVRHQSVATALIAAGKHVLAEPPFASTAAGCQSMIDAAQQAGTILQAALPRRHRHLSRWTRMLVRSGTLGRIVRVDWREGTVSDRDDVTEAVLWPDEGGVLRNPGVHAIDLATWWFDRIEVAAYRDDSLGGVESECLLEGRFGDGEGRLLLSRTRDTANTCRIEGEAGFVEVSLRNNWVVDCSDAVRAFQYDGLNATGMPQQTDADVYAAALAEFRTAIAAPRGPAADRTETSVAAVIERCYAQRGRLPMPWHAAPGGPAPEIPRGARVVITGATGFIGGNLAERLVRQGVQVRCLIRAPHSAIRLARLPVEFRRVDLTDAVAVDDALRDADYVFHCAYDWNRAGANHRAMTNLIDACIAHGVKRLVHLSTFSVYDPYPDGPLDETTPDGDRSFEYTRVKLELETILLEATRDRGLLGTILQPTIVYGPFSRPWTIGPAETLMRDTVVLPDHGEGLCNVQFVEDLVDAMILAATRPEAVGERFIVSGPDPVTWSEFYETVAQAVGAKGPAYWPLSRINEYRSGLKHKLRVVVNDPKKLVRLGQRVPGVRHLLKLLWTVTPAAARTAIQGRFGESAIRPGQLRVPGGNQINFLNAKPVVSSQKAARLIGYAPRFDFRTGMGFTSRYLAWQFPTKVKAENGTDSVGQASQRPDLAAAGSAGVV